MSIWSEVLDSVRYLAWMLNPLDTTLPPTPPVDYKEGCLPTSNADNDPGRYESIEELKDRQFACIQAAKQGDASTIYINQANAYSKIIEGRNSVSSSQ